VVDLQNLYWLQAVLAASLALFLSVYLWQHRAMAAARFLIAVLLEVAFWALAYALEYMSSSIQTRLFWVKVQFIGGVWLAPTFFGFSLCIAGLEKWIKWRQVWPLALIPLFTIVMAWTNSHHYLVYEFAWLDPSGPGVITAFSRGVVFWIYITYAYLLLMLGTLLLLRSVWKSRRLHRFRLSMLLIGIGLPWLVNALYLFEVKPFFYVDLTPLAFALTALLFTVGLFRIRIIHLIPLAREALMENLPDPVLILDDQDCLADLNSAAQRLLGPDARALLDMPVADIFSGQPALREFLDSAIDQQTELELEMQGEERAYEIRLSNLNDMRNLSVGRFLILRDITQRLSFQEELKRNEERYRTTFEHTGTAMMIAGGDAIITMVNSKFAELAGYSPEEIEGKMSWRDFVHPDDVERMEKYHLDRRESGDAPREYEFRFIDRNGNVRWIDNSVQLVPGTDLAVASLLDISDRKKSEEHERARLRRLQKQRASLVELATHPALVDGDMEKTARVVSEVVANTMQAERVAIWLLSGDGTALQCSDSYNLSSDEHKKSPDLPTKSFPRYMQSLESERSIPAIDAQRDPRTSEFNEILLKPGKIVSSLDAGVRLSGRVRGAICVNQVGGQRVWHMDEVRFVAEIADQVAQALLNQERRKADEALRESHQRYSTFLEGLPDPVVVYDPEGHTQYLNSAFEDTFGWKRQELLNKRIDFVPPECEEETREAVRSLAAGRQIQNFSTKRLTKDGNILDVFLSNSPYFDEKGDLAGNIVIFRDVTALAKAQARLAESEERYRSLVENSPFGLLIAEIPSGRLLYANKQLVDIFGYDYAKGDRMSMWDVLDPQDIEIAQKRLAQHFGKKTPSQGFVYTGRRKDGSRIRFRVTASLVQSRGKQVLQGIINDVTNEELMERQLQQAQKMEAVGTLAGGVAHEFNNLLMAIRGYSQLLTARKNLDPTIRNSLDKISQTTGRAADLANTMLSFSKPETGEKKPIDLNLAIKNVQGLLKGTLPPNIEKKIELAPELPLLLANPNQLEQVFLNLAVNARDAMPSGGVLTFRTGWRRADAAFRATRNWATEDIYVEVVIEDNGKGMGEEVQARIFEPFYTTKEPGKGTGLGLFVTYSIVTNHGGGIEVQSQAGKGTSFHIYLPADDELKPDEFEHKPKDELPMGHGQRLLIVDDEAALREITREALEAYGYQVVEASNGREALEKYEEQMLGGRDFDLVLLDLAMPVMDGAACFYQLTSMNPEAKVIIATGQAHTSTGLEKLQVRPMGIIKKPFDLSELLKEVNRALSDRPN
jgi:PAS domain S-box-containing protein